MKAFEKTKNSKYKIEDIDCDGKLLYLTKFTLNLTKITFVSRNKRYSSFYGFT